MVKGISKRAILVKALPNTIFEEAIFFLKEEIVTDGVDADEILKEAYNVAVNCSDKRKLKISKRVAQATSFTALGASIVGIIWMLSVII